MTNEDSITAFSLEQPMDNHQEFRLSTPFYDNENYSRGFGKYGDFSIIEADALHQFGRRLQELSIEKFAPESEDEKHFLLVCKGEKPANSFLEKLWLKYQSKLNKVNVCNGLFPSSYKADEQRRG